jgi:hypothetical protein
MSQSDIPGGMPGPTTPGAAGPGQQQPSEEELREYLGQMRAAPADAIIAEILQSLLQVAQVKLGRNDGRLVLDTIAAINDAVRGRVDQQLSTQVDDVLSQLRMAQVEAEGEVAQAAGSGHVEQNDIGGDGDAAGAASTGEAPTPASQRPPSQQPSSQQEPGGKRLWTPGG